MRTHRHMQIAVLGATILFFALLQTAVAGPPEKPGNPGVPGLLAEIAELNAQIEELEIIIQEYEEFAPVPQTGQTQVYDTGDDGDKKAGVQWPNPRFTENSDGTVTDNLTGLIWLKNANCFGEQTWADALNDCNNLKDGSCGLTDNSIAGDWRLPNVKELQSLIHYGVHDPALPDTSGMGKWSEGDPFTGVLCGVTNCADGYYWSSNTAAGSGDGLYIYLGGGFVQSLNKTHDGYFVWPVRGGN